MNFRFSLFRVVLIMVLGGCVSACDRSPKSTPPEAPPVSPAVTNQPVAATAEFDRLKGEWLRPDGGYILQIRSIAAGGKVEAGYRNPAPINVARAEVIKEGQDVKLFVELRDVNYPGSTYTLKYNPDADRLVGNYFQAAMQQNFQVEFIRMSKP